MICKDTKIWKYKSWLAQMKGWKDTKMSKDKRWFAKDKKIQNSFKDLHDWDCPSGGKDARPRCILKSLLESINAMYLEFYLIRKTFLWVNRCIWKMCRYIWEKKNPFNFATGFVCKECVISSTELLCLYARNSGCGKTFSKKLRLWKFHIVNSFAGRYLSLRRVI